MADENGDPVVERCKSGNGAADSERSGCGACVIDWVQVMGRIGDEELVREVMPICLADNREQLDALAAAVASADAAGVKMCAHTIKGSAANVGAMRLSGAALGLEQMAS